MKLNIAALVRRRHVRKTGGLSAFSQAGKGSTTSLLNPDELTRSLRNVLAVTDELLSSPDVDSMLRQAVEFARARIGLERCAIFLERDSLVRGTYGTDRYGNTIDEHDLVMDVNTGWHRYLERLKPDDAQWIVHQEDQVEWDGSKRVYIGKTGWVTHTRILLADGSRGIMTNDAAISNAPFDPIKQEITAVFCSLLGKIISHKQIQDEIRHALEKERELVEIKSQFINNISHEFRTPMAIIQSSLELLGRYGDRMDDAQRERHMSKMQDQIAQMTMLLNNTLSINKADKLGLPCEPEPVDLPELCQSAVEAVSTVSNPECRIRFAYRGVSTTCMLDRNLLYQIVMNLLMNALKYSPPCASISIEVACESQQVIIAVRDQGIGIPEADLPHIFSDFYRGENVGAIAGTGLGLSIVKRAAEAHGGSVAVESKEENGTTFTVVLPTASQ